MKTYDYKCFAYFYKLNDIPCRKYLDIQRSDLSDEQKPEVIIVMLNPGSCNNNNEWNIKIEVEPDATLHRIIALLDRKQYSCARIINLSDIQEKESKQFLKKKQELDQINIGNHSIFSRLSLVNPRAVMRL